MTKKFSVIIPTMWLSNYLSKMISVYTNSKFIDEIIIIDNAPHKKANIQSPKLKIHSRGVNIYVNPAWNLGVSVSKNPYIIIANDDILINDTDFNNLIETASSYLNDNVVVGPSESCFNSSLSLSKNSLKIEKAKSEFTYGFGTFMIMKKSSYTIIPNDVLIFHGDVIQHKTNESYVFSGIIVDTPMSVTLKSDPKIHELAKQDHVKASKYDIKTLKKSK